MKLKLVKKVEEAPDTVSFFWQTESKVNFAPGQYYYYTLPKLNYPDERGDTRHFTISVSPTEGELLRLTTRIRKASGYKMTLTELPIGAEISGRGPQGEFVLDSLAKNNKVNVFLAGGIGITPFRSMIKYYIDKKLSIPMYLIYSNSDSNFVFKDEIDSWTSKHDWLKVKYVNTSQEGRIDLSKLTSCIRNWKLDIGDLHFWLVGPPTFVNALEEVLQKMDVKENQIDSEKFVGY